MGCHLCGADSPPARLKSDITVISRMLLEDSAHPHTRTPAHPHTRTRTPTCTRTRICIFVFLHTHTHARMYVCVYLYMYTYIYMYRDIHYEICIYIYVVYVPSQRVLPAQEGDFSSLHLPSSSLKGRTARCTGRRPDLHPKRRGVQLAKQAASVGDTPRGRLLEEEDSRLGLFCCKCPLITDPCFRFSFLSRSFVVPGLLPQMLRTHVGTD